MQNVLGLGCGHEYCEQCWCQYLTTKIMDEGAAESIRCPTEGCEIIVDDITIMRMISDDNVRKKYQHLITNSFVQVIHSFHSIALDDLYSLSNLCD